MSHQKLRCRRQGWSHQGGCVNLERIHCFPLFPAWAETAESICRTYTLISETCKLITKAKGVQMRAHSAKKVSLLRSLKWRRDTSTVVYLLPSMIATHFLCCKWSCSCPHLAFLHFVPCKKVSWSQIHSQHTCNAKVCCMHRHLRLRHFFTWVRYLRLSRDHASDSVFIWIPLSLLPSYPISACNTMLIRNAR